MTFLDQFVEMCDGSRKHYIDTITDKRSALEAYFSDPRLFCYIAYNIDYDYENPKSTVIGFAIMQTYITDQQRCSLKKIFIHAGYRYRGVGSAFLHKVLQNEQNKGCKSIDVEHVWEDKLRCFFSKIGFVQGTSRHDFCCDLSCCNRSTPINEHRFYSDEDWDNVRRSYNNEGAIHNLNMITRSIQALGNACAWWYKKVPPMHSRSSYTQVIAAIGVLGAVGYAARAALLRK